MDYKQYAKWTEQNSFLVTRLKDNAVYEQLAEIDISESCPDNYIKDEKIQIRYKDKSGQEQLLTLRRVVYYDKQKDRIFQFLTNIFEMTAGQIGLLYKMRLQIELLFKQLRQNFPLKYFLGDNENAFLIQKWCTLIANLLFTIIRKTSAERSYSVTW